MPTLAQTISAAQSLRTEVPTRRRAIQGDPRYTQVAKDEQLAAYNTDATARVATLLTDFAGAVVPSDDLSKGATTLSPDGLIFALQRAADRKIQGETEQAEKVTDGAALSYLASTVQSEIRGMMDDVRALVRTRSQIAQAIQDRHRTASPDMQRVLEDIVPGVLASDDPEYVALRRYLREAKAQRVNTPGKQAAVDAQTALVAQIDQGYTAFRELVNLMGGGFTMQSYGLERHFSLIRRERDSNGVLRFERGYSGPIYIGEAAELSA